MRPSGRKAEELRAVRIVRGYTRHAEGSVLVAMGDTQVLCTVSVEESVPSFLKGKGQGWLTAEYGNVAPESADVIVALGDVQIPAGVELNLVRHVERRKERRSAVACGGSVASANDADAMEGALKDLGFKVTKKKDLDLEQMQDALVDFIDENVNFTAHFVL